MLPSTLEKPIVTVVLVCFNYEQYIDEALSGLFAQTYTPLDIIILDDCSSDLSADIIEKRLAQRNKPPNARFIRNSRNLVNSIPPILPLVKGQFVMLVSADDVMLPHMVERLVQTWLEQRVSLVTANVIYIDDKSRPLGRTARGLGVPVDDSFETLARDGANACCFGAAMGFERAVIETFGWPPADFFEAGDIVLPFYAYLLKGARFIDEPLLKYRVHSRNSSLSLLSEKETGEAQILAANRAFTNHLKQAIFFDEELDRLRAEAPQRYAEIAGRIRPLVGIQITEMARKLVRSHKELYDLRVRQRGGS
jgi:glycosyltransferase involved in cell wall biosynthesis